MATINAHAVPQALAPTRPAAPVKALAPTDWVGNGAPWIMDVTVIGPAGVVAEELRSETEEEVGVEVVEVVELVEVVVTALRRPW